MPPADAAATASRPNPATAPQGGRFARVLGLPWPAILLALLALATLIGFFVYPMYPNYDSYYSLIWGREILHGHLPSGFFGARSIDELGVATTWA